MGNFITRFLLTILAIIIRIGKWVGKSASGIGWIKKFLNVFLSGNILQTIVILEMLRELILQVVGGQQGPVSAFITTKLFQIFTTMMGAVTGYNIDDLIQQIPQSVLNLSCYLGLTSALQVLFTGIVTAMSVIITMQITIVSIKVNTWLFIRYFKR